jgi:hypothetical protein
MERNQPPPKAPYEKPRIQPFRLATDELAATGCKLVNVPMGPATGCIGKYGVCRHNGS